MDEEQEQAADLWNRADELQARATLGGSAVFAVLALCAEVRALAYIMTDYLEETQK